MAPVHRLCRATAELTGGGGINDQETGHSQWESRGLKMNRIMIIADGRLWADAISAVLGDEVEVTEARPETSVDRLAMQAEVADTVVIGYDSVTQSCLETSRELRQRCPDVALVIVGIPDNPHLILSYLEAGCTAYVRSSDSLERLQQILCGGNGKETAIDPHTAAVMLERLRELRQQVYSIPGYTTLGGNGEHLTEREQEVLQLIASGLTNQEIADRLFIEVGTAKNHVHNVLRKLDARDRREAAQYHQAMQLSQSTQASNGSLNGKEPEPAGLVPAAAGQPVSGIGAPRA